MRSIIHAEIQIGRPEHQVLEITGKNDKSQVPNGLLTIVFQALLKLRLRKL